MDLRAAPHGAADGQEAPRPAGPDAVSAAHQGEFFLKKGLKKLKFEKGVSAWNISKNGCLPLVDRAGGDIPPNQRAGCSKKFFAGPSRGPLRE
jgi:hypothetical protein